MADKYIFTIGEFMQKSGVSIRTLRYYDSIDLLKPSDYTEGGHRLYSKEELQQWVAFLQFSNISFLPFCVVTHNYRLHTFYQVFNTFHFI